MVRVRGSRRQRVLALLSTLAMLAVGLVAGASRPPRHEAAPRSASKTVRPAASTTTTTSPPSTTSTTPTTLTPTSLPDTTVPQPPSPAPTQPKVARAPSSKTRPPASSTTSTTVATVATEASPAGDDFHIRPYAPSSPWNSRIGAESAVHPDNARLMSSLSGKPPLTSDPTQYTYPVYRITSSTPRRTVAISGYFSTYLTDSTRKGHGFAPTITDVPVPADAIQSSGSDGSIIFWDPSTGDEWAFWQWSEEGGQARAKNGYRYNSSWSGRFFDGLAGRGAGIPYLAGLVRPWEVASGRIDHALAFAYSSPSPEFVYPASKSDGRGTTGVDLPEGTRLQLDPSLTEADFDRMGLTREAQVVARALQEYGMIVVDNSGSSKIMLEDEKTADWGAMLNRTSVSAIPLSSFRVVAP